MRNIVSEEQKDEMVDPFIRLCKEKNMIDYRFPDFLRETKANCFKELYRILLERVNKYTLPIGYSFTDTYKAWCGIIFRAKCLDIDCAYLMHPFDYLTFTEKLGKDDIVEFFETSHNWRSCVKQCKAIRKNSMVKV